MERSERNKRAELPALQHTAAGGVQAIDVRSQAVRRGKIIAAVATEPRRIRMTCALLLRRAHMLLLRKLLLLRICVRTADTRHECQRDND